MTMKQVAVAAAFLFSMGSAAAANTGELWEVTSQMSMPGMPAMGAQKSQVCTDKNQSPAAGRSDCKVTNRKRSGLTESMTVSCPNQGEMMVEMTYNAARTEYKGKMTMSGGRAGSEMTMITSGRKVGACDPQVAQAERDQKVASARAQGERARAQANAVIKQSQDDEIANCAAAVQTMDVHKLGRYWMCEASNTCDAYLKTEQTRPVAVKCMANRQDYCRRYQTLDGFLKAKGDEQGATMCKVSAPQLKASMCPRAAKEEHLGFLGAYCPAEAKPIAKAHCAGRDYTSKAKDKYTDFCAAYISRHGADDLGDSKPSRAASSESKTATERASDGVQTGINKLKGLFGR